MRSHLQRAQPAPQTAICPATVSYAANALRAASQALFVAAEDDRRDLSDPARQRFLKEAHFRAVTAATMLEQLGW